MLATMANREVRVVEDVSWWLALPAGLREPRFKALTRKIFMGPLLRLDERFLSEYWDTGSLNPALVRPVWFLVCL